jgi:hypothetical protein
MRATAVAIVLVACGSSGASGALDARSIPDADPGAVSVGGTYPTDVSLRSSTCTGITVQSMTTTVAHAPGASELTLTHAGQTYSGTVARDGTFATTPHAVGPATELHTLTIAGQFSTTGFTATVTAAVSSNGVHQCDYVVGWLGAKSGAPNVIPG